MKQGTDEWLLARRGYITASRFKEVMAKGKGLTAESYLDEKLGEHLTGEPAEVYVTPAMARGTALEPVAAGFYEIETGQTVEAVGTLRVPGLWISGSPDGLVPPDGCIEIKCPAKTARHVRSIRRHYVPPEYWAQVIGNMWITGAQWCDYISFDPRVKSAEHRLYVIRITRTKGVQKDIDELAKTVEAFEKNMLVEVEKLGGTVLELGE